MVFCLWDLSHPKYLLLGYLYVAYKADDPQEVCSTNIFVITHNKLHQGIEVRLYDTRPDTLAYHDHTLEIMRVQVMDTYIFIKVSILNKSLKFIISNG